MGKDIKNSPSPNLPGFESTTHCVTLHKFCGFSGLFPHLSETTNALDEILHLRVKAPCRHTAGLRQCQPRGFLLLWRHSQSLRASASPVGPCESPPHRRGMEAEEQEGLVSPSKGFHNPDQQGSRGPIWKAVLAKPALPALLLPSSMLGGLCSWSSKPGVPCPGAALRLHKQNDV